MVDVLVVSVPIEGRYPSLNQLGKDGRRFGRKNEEYKTLFAAVKSAAIAEMERTGWTTAGAQCEVMVTRYVRDQRRRDASNLAKCELDALTAAGVWQDDSQATRVVLEIERDPVGSQRVVIVVRRRYTTAVELAIATKPPTASKTKPREPIAYLNGEAITMSEAMNFVKGS